ncbi:MAG: gliding motility protein GldB, partial [Prevotella sp.]|nr:gliding motility protein GldB [Prevotella sp.]
YLGKDFPVYKLYYDSQQRETMTPEHIVPDVLVFYLLSSYGMFEYARTSQTWRDTNMGVVMYVANKLVGREAFKNEDITKVAEYMRRHPGTTLKNLLEMTDYSEF